MLRRKDLTKIIFVIIDTFENDACISKSSILLYSCLRKVKDIFIEILPDKL